MDKLEELLKKQKELDGFIAQKRGLKLEPKEWIRRKCTALICEVSELLDEVDYKWWKSPKESNDTAVKEEIIDVLHFFLGICNDAGLTADEIYDVYMSKNKENKLRQTGQSQSKDYSV